MNLENNLKKLKNTKPDSMWVETLRNRLELKVNEPANSRKAAHENIFIRTFGMLQMQDNQKLGLKFFGALIFTTVLVTLTYFSVGNLRGTNLTDAEQQQILLDIIAKNPENANTKVASLNSTASAESDDAMSTSSLKIRGENEYKYSYSKFEGSRGPKLDKCMYFDSTFGDAFLTTENFNYYSEADNSHYKTVVYNSDGSISSYFLTNSDDTSSVSYEYMGGKYAIKSTNLYDPVTPEEMSSVKTTPTDEVVVEEDSAQKIKDYFGENAEVKEVVKKDGKEFYLIEALNRVNCSEPNYQILELRLEGSVDETPEEDLSNVIVQQLVNSETLEVIELKNYLDKVSDDTLINTNKFTNVYSNDPFVTFQKEFTFDLGVSVKEVTHDSRNAAEKEKTALVDYLSKSNLPIVFASNLELSSMYAPESSKSTVPNYYADRDFYPTGSKGDESHRIATAQSSNEAWYNQTLVDMYFSKTEGENYQSADLHIHKTDLSAKDLVKNYGFTNGDISEENTEIEIDGQKVQGKKFTMVQEIIPYADDTIEGKQEPMIAPAPDCAGDDCKQTSTIYYFELNGHKYVVNATNVDLSKLGLTTKKYSSDKDYIQNQINGMYERMKNLADDVMI
jgi:hypothetical protein